jgi:hypothetical protein
MPTKHVIAMLNSAGAAQGADTLLAMPADRIEVLIDEMTPTEVGRLLAGARADRKADLLSAIGPYRAPSILALFTVHQLADLVSSLPMPAAVNLVRSMNPHAAADMLMEIPTQQRLILQEEVLAPQQPQDLTSTAYHREVEESVSRIATQVTWLDQPGGHLLAEVMGRPLEIVMRHMPEAPFDGDDVRAAAGRVDWRRAVGALVLTNATPTDTVSPVIRELREHGHPINVVRWLNEGDDGILKRALVRLVF